MISYWRLAEASPVFFWFFLDMVAHQLRHFMQFAEAGAFPWGILKVLTGLSYWLGLVPILVRVLFRLAWAMQAKCACRLLDYFKSLLLLLPGIFLFGSFLSFDICLSGHLELGALYLALILVPLAALVWRSLPVPVPQQSIRAAGQPHAQS